MHWKYKGKIIKTVEDFPKDTLGFIYRITNHSKNNKFYVGRKTAVSFTKKALTIKEKNLAENKRKKFKKILKESNWKKYWGSSKELLEDIENGDNCTREILRFCFSKAELSYYEAKEILCSDCLLNEENYNYWMSWRVYAKNLKK